MSQLRQRDPEFRSAGAEIIAISPDNITATKELAERLELSFTVLSDPELAVADAYRVRHDDEPKGRLIPRPSVFVISPEGIIEFAYVGQSPSDRPAENDLLAAVRGQTRADRP